MTTRPRSRRCTRSSRADETRSERRIYGPSTLRSRGSPPIPRATGFAWIVKSRSSLAACGSCPGSLAASSARLVANLTWVDPAGAVTSRTTTERLEIPGDPVRGLEPDVSPLHDVRMDRVVYATFETRESADAHLTRLMTRHQGMGPFSGQLHASRLDPLTLPDAGTVLGRNTVIYVVGGVCLGMVSGLAAALILPVLPGLGGWTFPVAGTVAGAFVGGAVRRHGRRANPSARSRRPRRRLGGQISSHRARTQRLNARTSWSFFKTMRRTSASADRSLASARRPRLTAAARPLDVRARRPSGLARHRQGPTRSRPHRPHVTSGEVLARHEPRASHTGDVGDL